MVNFLTLFKETGQQQYLTQAERLATTVHDVLGRTRDGQARLPGASDENPVGGGLRIGKMEEGGQDGDGQYHHYLTIWMFALNRLSMASQEWKWNEHAIALAKAIHPRFFIGRETERPRMVWKIAMDMSRSLVNSEGNFDPIDGYVIFRKLQAASGSSETLKEEIGDYERIMERKGKHFVSNDPLDLGMSLWTSHWMAVKEEWASDLAKRCVGQMRQLFQSEYLGESPKYRLAFREYGTAMGIGCAKPDDYLEKQRQKILDVWEQYKTSTPGDLRPISEVMRAAAEVSGAFQAGYFGPEPAVD